MLKYFLSIVATVLFLACTKKDEYADLNCGESPTSYQSDIRPIIAANCLNVCCHGAGSPNGNYSTYDGVMIRVKNGSLSKRVLYVKDMPQNGTALSLTERRKIKCWLESGAPNN